MSPRPRLLFVYNADGGVLNGLRDLWHKAAHPETYPCSLCGVTYGWTGMKREWRDFVRGLDREVVFLHRDEFHRQYGLKDVPLPAVFEATEARRPALWLGADELNAARTLDALIALVRDRQARPTALATAS